MGNISDCFHNPDLKKKDGGISCFRKKTKSGGDFCA